MQILSVVITVGILLLNVSSKYVLCDTDTYGLYGVQVAATLKENLVNALGYIMYQPTVNIGGDLYAHLHYIKMGLKTGELDVFALIPILHTLLGDDYDTQFSKLLKTLESQMSRKLCHLKCSSTLFKASKLDLNTLLADYDNLLLAGILNEENDADDLEDLGSLVKSKPARKGAVDQLNRRLSQVVKEIQEGQTHVTSRLVGYLLVLLPFPSYNPKLGVELMTLKQYLVSKKCTFEPTYNSSVIGPRQMLIDVLGIFVDSESPLVTRIAALNVRKWLVEELVESDYRRTFRGTYIDLHEMTDVFQIVTANDYPAEIVLAARRVERFAHKILATKDFEEIKPYMFNSKEEVLLMILNFIQIQAPTTNVEITQSVKAIKPHLVFHSGPRQLTYNTLVSLLDTFAAVDLDERVKQHSSEVQAYIARYANEINDIIERSPRTTCYTVFDCYGKVLRIITKDANNSIDMSKLTLHRCFFKRYISPCGDDDQTPVDQDSLFNIIDYTQHPGEVVAAAKLLKQKISELGQWQRPFKINHDDYCTTHEIALEYFDELVQLNARDDINDLVKAVKPHLELLTKEAGNVDVLTLKKIIDSTILPGADPEFVEEIHKSQRFIDDNRAKVIKTLNLLGSSLKCTSAPECYDTLTQHINQQNMGLTLPPRSSGQSPKIQKKLNSQSLLEFLDQVQENSPKEFDAAKEYVKNNKLVFDKYLATIDDCDNVNDCFNTIKATIANAPDLNPNIINYLLSPAVCDKDKCTWISYDQVGTISSNPVLEYTKELLETLADEAPLSIQLAVMDILQDIDTAGVSDAINEFDLAKYKTDKDKIAAFSDMVAEHPISSKASAEKISDYLKYKQLPQTIEPSYLEDMFTIMMDNAKDKSEKDNLVLLQQDVHENSVLRDTISNCTFNCKNTKTCIYWFKKCVKYVPDEELNSKLTDLLEDVYPTPKDENFMVTNLKVDGKNAPYVLQLDDHALNVLSDLSRQSRNDAALQIVNVLDDLGHTVTLALNLDDSKTQKTIDRLARTTPLLTKPIYIPVHDKKCDMAALTIPSPDMPFIKAVTLDLNKKQVGKSLKRLHSKDAENTVTIELCDQSKVSLDMDDKDVWNELTKLSDISPPISSIFVTKPSTLLPIQTKDMVGNDITVNVDTDNATIVSYLQMLDNLTDYDIDGIANAHQIYMSTEDDIESLYFNPTSLAAREILLESGTIEQIVPQNYSYVVTTLDDNGVNTPIILDVGDFEVNKALQNLSQFVDYSQPITVIDTTDQYGEKFKFKLNMDDENTKTRLKELSRKTKSNKLTSIDQDGQHLVALMATNDQGNSFPVVLDLDNRKVISKLKKLNDTTKPDAAVLYVKDNGRTVPISIDLHDDETITNLIEIMDQCPVIYPYSTQETNTVTVPVKDSFGNDLLVTLNTDNDTVVEELKTLSKYGRGPNPTTIPIKKDGKVFPITLDLSHEHVIDNVLALGDPAPAQPKKDNLFVYTSLDDDTFQTNVLNASDSNVLELLKKLSKDANTDEPLSVLDVTNDRGETFHFKLNMGDEETKNALKRVNKIVKKMEPMLIPQKKMQRPLLALTVDHDGELATVILDTNIDQIRETLKELSRNVDRDKFVPVIYIKDDYGKIPIRLDLDNDTVSDILYDLAQNNPADVDFFNPAVPRFQTVVLKDLYDNIIATTFDVSDKHVVDVLKSLDSEDDGATVYVYDDDGTVLPITLDTNDENVREVLPKIGTVKLVTDKGPSVLALTVTDDDGKVVPIFLDLQDDNVNAVLQNLSRSAAGDGVSVLNTMDEDGKVTKIKLNLNDSTTVKTLQDLSSAMPIELFQIPQPDQTSPLLGMTVSADGNVVPILLDTSDDRILTKLIKMTKKNENNQYASTVYIKDQDGQSIPIRIDTDNRRDARQLIKLMDRCPVIQSPFATLLSPLVSFQMEDDDGNKIEVTIDTNDRSALNVLKGLSVNPDFANLHVYVPSGDGDVTTVHLNLNDDYVKTMLPKLGAVVPIAGNFMVLNVPVDDGKVAPIIVDLNQYGVLDSLKDLSKDVDRSKPHVIIDGFEEDDKIRLDTNDDKTKELLTELSKYTKLNTPLQIPRQGERYPMLAFTVPDGEVSNPVLLDMNDPEARKTLMKMTDKNENNQEATAMVIKGPNGEKTMLRLDLTDPKAKNKLLRLSQLCPVVGHPYLSRIPQKVTLTVDDPSGKKVEVVLDTADENVVNRLKSLSRPLLYQPGVVQLYVQNADGMVNAITLDTNDDSVRELLMSVGKVNVPKKEVDYVLFHLPDEQGYTPITLEMTDDTVSTLKSLEKYNTAQSPVISLIVKDTNGAPFNIILNTLCQKSQNIIKNMAAKTKTKKPIIIPQAGKLPIVALTIDDEEGQSTSIFLDLSNDDVMETLAGFSEHDQDSDDAIIFSAKDTAGKPISFAVDPTKRLKKLLKLSKVCPIIGNPYRTLRTPLLSIPIRDISGESIVVILDTNDQEVVDNLRTLSHSSSMTSPVFYMQNKDGSKSAIRLDVHDRQVKLTLPKLGRVTRVEPVPNTWAILSLNDGSNTPIFVDMENPKMARTLRTMSDLVKYNRPVTVINAENIDGDPITIALNMDKDATKSKLRKLMKLQTSVLKPVTISVTDDTSVIAFTVPYKGKMVPIVVDSSYDTLQKLKEISSSTPDSGHTILYMPIEEDRTIPIYLDVTDAKVIKTLRSLTKKAPFIPRPFSTSTLKYEPCKLVYVQVPDGNNNIILPLDTSDAQTVATLKQLSNPPSGGPSVEFFIMDETDRYILITLDPNDENMLNTLKTLSRNNMVKIFPRIVAPPHGIRNLIPLRLSVPSGGTVQGTLDPNNLDALKYLKLFADLSQDNDTKKYITVEDKDYEDIKVPITPMDVRSSIVVNMVSNLSPIQIGSMRVYMPNTTKALLAFSLKDQFGGTTPFTLDLSDQQTIDLLENLSDFVPFSRPVMFIQVRQPNRTISLRLDLSEDDTIETLKLLSDQCPVNIISMKGKKPYVTILPDAGSRRIFINTNSDVVMEKLRKLSRENPDQSLKTYFLFETTDGFDEPIALQLQNPVVRQKLMDLFSPFSIEEVQVTLQEHNAALIPLTLSMQGKIIPVTLDISSPETLDLLRSLGSGGTIDLSDPEVNKELLELSSQSPIQLYPLKVIPARGKEPMVIIHLPQQDVTLNLDLNDGWTLDKLRKISREYRGKDADTISVTNGEGQMKMFKLNLQDDETLESLSEESPKCMICVKHVDGGMPILTLKTPGGSDELLEADLDLGDPQVLNDLVEFTKHVTFDPYAHRVEIYGLDGTWNVLKLDLTNPEFLQKYFPNLQPSVPQHGGAIQYHTITIPGKTPLDITLNLEDPQTWSDLKHIAESYNGEGQPVLVNLVNGAGESLDLQFDMYDTDVIERLKGLHININEEDFVAI